MTTRSPARSGTDAVAAVKEREAAAGAVVSDMPIPEDDCVLPEDRCLCFVCTGNTCRSPMAEAFMKSRGYKNAFSRGISASEGEPISDGAVRALADAGIASVPGNDYESHRAKNISEDDLARADGVYCMTSSHAKMLMFFCPRFAGKIHVLPKDISDPYGGDLEQYKKTLAEISSALVELFPSL